MHWSQLKSPIGFNNFADKSDSLESFAGCCFMSEGMQPCPSVRDIHFNSWIKVVAMVEPSTECHLKLIQKHMLKF